METLVVIGIFLFGFFLGAVCHEKDLSRNFNKTGNSKAWFYEIKQ